MEKMLFKDLQKAFKGSQKRKSNKQVGLFLSPYFQAQRN